MNELQTTTPSWTPSQQQLIKSTYARGASNEEFEIFLYKCKHLGLDPIKGQIHFVKYGTEPGKIVIGLDGYRSRAARTGNHNGTERGVLRDKNGNVTHGWCKIYRKGWDHPAYEESPLEEYNTKRGQWAKMPETMIKKIAEVAALRMAFPDELAGLESDLEHDSAEAEAKEIHNQELHKKADAHVERIMKDMARVDRETEERQARRNAEKANRAVLPPSEVTDWSPEVAEPVEAPKKVLNHATGESVEVKYVDHTKGPWETFVIRFGKHTGKTLADLGLKQAVDYAKWLTDSAEKNKKPLQGDVLALVDAVGAWQASVGNEAPLN